MSIEFQPWPKIARLNREIVITEKIDGTNAAVVIEQFDASSRDWSFAPDADNGPLVHASVDGKAGIVTRVFAQSRTRFITPEDDNHGFAKWVQDNANELVHILGVGTHFGEWWGSGIQRGYGLPKGEKRFSLFNVGRWGTLATALDPQHTRPTNFESIPGLHLVPELYRGRFSEYEIQMQLAALERNGSEAAPGFMNPEGIIVWHEAARTSFKVTIKNDDEPKAVAEARIARRLEIAESKGIAA
jgi:hypothetical protein